MKTVELHFLSRFKLTELLGNQSGTLSKTAPYLRVLDKVRFSDTETAQIKRVKVGESMVSFQPPTDPPDFGKLSASLEDADCTALLDLLENHQGFTTADHTWADPLLAALR